MLLCLEKQGVTSRTSRVFTVLLDMDIKVYHLFGTLTPLLTAPGTPSVGSAFESVAL